MSSDPIEDEIATLARNLDDVRGLFRQYAGAVSGTSRAEVHVNAGGVGVWISTTACLVMLSALLVGTLFVLREFTRYDAQIAELRANDKTQADYLAAIYMQAPHLKPKE